MSKSGVAEAVVYLDDIVLHGGSVDEVWGNTLRVLKSLTDAGFMMNINKCSFLTSKIKVVGYQVCQGLYEACNKTLCKFLRVKLPNNYQQLQ